MPRTPLHVGHDNAHSPFTIPTYVLNSSASSLAQRKLPDMTFRKAQQACVLHMVLQSALSWAEKKRDCA